jgi:hypothetical protein
MSGQGPNVHCSPHFAGPDVNTGSNIVSISPINTGCNFGKQSNNYGNQFNNQGNRGTQLNNQGNRGTQVYNQGTQKTTYDNHGNVGIQGNQGTVHNQTFNKTKLWQVWERIKAVRSCVDVLLTINKDCPDKKNLATFEAHSVLSLIVMLWKINSIHYSWYGR